MNLTAALDQAGDGLQRFAQALRAVSAAPVRVDVAPIASASTDRILADAIKRGQSPQFIEALKRALNV